MVFAVVLRLICIAVYLAAFVYWLYCLGKFEGGCPCDKSQCKDCVYHGICEYEENEEDIL